MSQKPPAYASDWVGEAIVGALAENNVTPDQLSDIQEKTLGLLLPKLAGALHDELKRTARGAIHRSRRMETRHAREVQTPWRAPLMALRAIVLLTFDVGEEVFRKSIEGGGTPSHLMAALLPLCARGTQIGREIVCLLEAGYPDGAHARWRTLHELAITAAFLRKQGNETAERYLLYDMVDALKGARKYQTAAHKYGLEPLAANDMHLMEEEVETLKRRYGKDFCGNYGWAAALIPKRPVTFSEIEAASGVVPTRAAYTLASYNVHATPRGIMTRLSHSEPGELLTGPSVEGLGQPTRQTAASLWLLYQQLLLAEPNPTRRVYVGVLEAMVRDVASETLGRE